MRALFFILVFVNVVYFAWANWVDVSHPPPTNQVIARLPRLKLVAELPLSDQPGSGARMVMNDSRACLSVGPFGDIAKAAKAAGILRGKGFDPRQRASQGQASSGYWVYVGGLKSDDEAERVRAGLQHGGFKDALVMPPGPDAGRHVSLGLFSDKARAEARVAAVKKLGFTATVTERELPVTVYWIDLAPRPGMTTVPLEGLFAEGVDSRIVVEPCPVAPAPAVAPPVNPPQPLKEAQAPVSPPIAETTRPTT